MNIPQITIEQFYSPWSIVAALIALAIAPLVGVKIARKTNREVSATVPNKVSLSPGEQVCRFIQFYLSGFILFALCNLIYSFVTQRPYGYLVLFPPVSWFGSLPAFVIPLTYQVYHYGAVGHKRKWANDGECTLVVFLVTVILGGISWGFFSWGVNKTREAYLSQLLEQQECIEGDRWLSGFDSFSVSRKGDLKLLHIPDPSGNGSKQIPTFGIQGEQRFYFIEIVTSAKSYDRLNYVLGREDIALAHVQPVEWMKQPILDTSGSVTGHVARIPRVLLYRDTKPAIINKRAP